MLQSQLAPQLPRHVQVADDVAVIAEQRQVRERRVVAHTGYGVMLAEYPAS